ncbi:hypothetical protein [Nocardia terpenica]|uniref:Uncharacterized protein n=1 Tax=Nocardia terpenica TaxID=455432 RepID=A0A164HV32_9NOCA|nr:hypothetical protein [Nocardia terpenica]KZM68844.1 hypothetical protein AWN90_13730 [Nocardia terpenica]NQE88114.1 hypothetical protein [Nocardia terpenica]
MPLFAGPQKLKTLQVGGQKVKEGWLWSGSAWQKVYASVPPFSFVEEFNTAYPDSLGPAWTFISGTKGRVVSGHAVLATTGTTGKVTSWHRPTGIVAPQDDVVVKFRMTAPTPYGAATDNETVIALRCTDDASINDGVWIVLMGGKSRIFTMIGGTQAARGTEGTYPLDVDLEFRAIGRTYSLVRTDTNAVLTSWTDSGSATLVDAAHRAFKVALTGNYPFLQKQYNSPAIDRIECILPGASDRSLKRN